jgi:hypothetical protein
MNGTGRDQADVVMQASGLYNHPTLESAVEAIATAVGPR